MARPHDQGRPSIFLFGNSGHGSIALKKCIESGERVIGVCSKLEPRTLSRRNFRKKAGAIARLMGLSRTDDFLYRDPFEATQTVASLARAHGIHLFSSRELHGLRLKNFIRSAQPDLILCCSFHRLIPLVLLEAARWRAVNLHPGLLPDRAGGTPNRWAVRLGDAQTGVTAHVMTERFDEGDVLLEHRVTLKENDTWGDVEGRVAPLVTKATAEVIDALYGRYELTLRAQSGSVETMPSYGLNHSVIDWSGSPADVRRTCYAMRPKSGGMTTSCGRKICIWDLAASRDLQRGAPGNIVSIDDSGRPIVATGAGNVVITKILLRGRIRDAANLTKGGPLSPGYILGGD